MGKIVLLDELTINQIAAGEVIERPASVIKEMVENSIDAGATQITVEIKNGGISYIRITDNGKGIAKDDVEMAFERHATSKIRSAVDLQDVKSMGFRGEALASIAAISNVELISKTEDSEIGTKVNVEGGNILNIEDVGCSTGTIITVRNLFYNTPVRYKFLKKDFTETGYIEDVLKRIALVHPEIAIKLINTGKIAIQTNGSGELKNVVYSLYGKEIASEILPVEYQYEYINVKGVIGKPAIARSNRANQLFFVNKRYIKDKSLTAGAEQAFKGLIPLGKFGFLILNLEMNPSKVDVNVHPAKLEVRFEDEGVAFKAVYHAIKNTLLSSDLISDRERNKEIKEASKDAFKIQPQANILSNGGLFNKGIHFENKIENLQQEMQKIEPQKQENEIIYDNKPIYQNENKELELKQNSEIVQKNFAEENLNNSNEQKMEETIGVKTDEIIQESNDTNKPNATFEEMYKKLFGKEPYGGKRPADPPKEDQYRINENDLNDNISVFEDMEEYKKTTYKFIGIAFKTYIILEMNQELYIMDQHAAHERILYEKIKANFYTEGPKDSQLMLLPDIITLSTKEMNIAKDNFDLFEKAGFMLEEFGENTITLYGVPEICIDLETKELFMETLDEINTVARTAKQEKEEKFIATVACKAAVKANMALTEEEVDSLMDELLKLPNPFSCPHGRPTVIKMSKYDIERKFARK